MKKCILAGMAAALLLTGCKAGGPGPGNGAWRSDAAAQDLVNAVSDELGDDYWPDAELAPEFLDDWYGISDDMYEEYYGQTSLSSENADALIVVKAEPERLEDVQNALDTYREAMRQDSLQYPSNMPKFQASVIRTYGNYVCFVQLGGALDGAGDEEEAVAICASVNEQALAVIEKELTK